jgi:hypothetical protein
MPHSGTNYRFFDLKRSVRASAARSFPGPEELAAKDAQDAQASRTARTPRVIRRYSICDRTSDGICFSRPILLRFRAFPLARRRAALIRRGLLTPARMPGSSPSLAAPADRAGYVARTPLYLARGSWFRAEGGDAMGDCVAVHCANAMRLA